VNKDTPKIIAKEQKHIENHKELSLEDINTFVKERFNEVKESKQIKELVSFQSTNKFLIMAHSQEELKIMGRIVAASLVCVSMSNIRTSLSMYSVTFLLKT